MKTTLQFVAFALLVCQPAMADTPHVITARVPDGGIQPQVAVGDDGTVHMIYYVQGWGKNVRA